MITTAFWMIVSGDAHAWKWAPDATLQLPYIGYRYEIQQGAFEGAEHAAVVNGARMWDAGPAKDIQPGSLMFELVLGDSSQPTPCNGVNEIGRVPDWLFDAYFRPNSRAMTMYCTAPPALAFLWDYDVVFREGLGTSIPACTGAPSECVEPPWQMLAAHEFGHAAGFNHEYDYLSVMGRGNNYGGDNGIGFMEVSESDAKGVAVKHPGTGTQHNLTLRRWRPAGGGAAEVWTSRNPIWDLGDGAWRAGQGGPPENLMGLMIGPGTRTSTVQWYLVEEDNDCRDPEARQWNIGTRRPSMVMNIAYSIGPNSWDLGQVPQGDYRLCAKIDALDENTERNELDNVVQSPDDTYVRVRP